MNTAEGESGAPVPEEQSSRILKINIVLETIQ